MYGDFERKYSFIFIIIYTQVPSLFLYHLQSLFHDIPIIAITNPKNILIVNFSRFDMKCAINAVNIGIADNINPTFEA